MPIAAVASRRPRQEDISSPVAIQSAREIGVSRAPSRFRRYVGATEIAIAPAARQSRTLRIQIFVYPAHDTLSLARQKLGSSVSAGSRAS